MGKIVGLWLSFFFFFIKVIQQKIEKKELLFAANTNVLALIYKRLETDRKS